MAISDNPTKTRGIEKAWNRDINRRFSSFSKSVIGEVRALSRLVVNEFDANPDQLRAYMLFFQRELDRLIVGDWQEVYQQRSYQLAIDRSVQELRRQGVSVAAQAGAGLATSELAALTQAFTQVSSSIFNPVHQEALSFLFTRSFESLSGLSQEMARTVRIILFNGAQQGIGINELAKQINDRVSVGRSRARTIARTETNQAFQRGSINQANLASEFLDEDVMLRWLTVRDNKVRHLHAGWHGQVFSRKNAFKNINISPWNCRCGLAPVIEEADTEAKRTKFAKERKQLRELTNQ